MEALRLPPPDAPVEKLSGGEKRRVALCRLLISNPDVLLLDEPTNHLDAESVAWLEAYLKKFKGTLVVVTHDRYFLNNVTEWILELDGGHAYPYKGNYEAWLAQKQALLECESKQAVSRRKLLEQELQWVRLNPAGRQAKNKARLNRLKRQLASVSPALTPVTRSTASITCVAPRRWQEMPLHTCTSLRPFGVRLKVLYKVAMRRTLAERDFQGLGNLMQHVAGQPVVLVLDFHQHVNQVAGLATVYFDDLIYLGVVHDV